MTATQKTVTLQQYNNEIARCGVTYLWLVSTAQPAGVDYSHDVESDGDDYCDVTELIGDLGLWDLAGEIDEHGRWCWDGQGSPRDQRGNSLLNVKAGF